MFQLATISQGIDLKIKISTKHESIDIPINLSDDTATWFPHQKKTISSHKWGYIQNASSFVGGIPSTATETIGIHKNAWTFDRDNAEDNEEIFCQFRLDSQDEHGQFYGHQVMSRLEYWSYLQISGQTQPSAHHHQLCLIFDLIDL